MRRQLTYLIVFGLAVGTTSAQADLIHHLKLDEDTVAGDTIAVDSVGDLYGTIQGATSVPGKTGNALSFDGSDDVVTILNFVPPQQGTIVFWMDPGFATSKQRVFGAGGDYELIVYNDGRVRNELFAGGSGTLNSSTGAVESGQWNHIAVTYVYDSAGPSTALQVYVDGEFDTSGIAGEPSVPSDTTLLLGHRAGASDGERYGGLLDDIRIYDHVLSEAEIKALTRPPRFTAYDPDPPDGVLHEDTSVILSWSLGDFAVSHNVYLGDNFDDVDAGTGDTFQGNQPSTFFVAGFPGFPYPDGLVPGTTYYWRIDEVNDLDPNSPWKGDVWSFMIPPKTAYDPEPADGAKFVDPNVGLSWTAGFGSKLHTVYFGDNFDDVNSATTGLPQGTTTYTPGTLELDKTYYWRVDEFDGFATYKGDVWSLTTAGLGGGVRANYYRGMNFESHVLTRIDPEISFNWGNGEPDPAVGADQFSIRWTGEVEAAFTETYTFYTNSDDGIRLWVDGQQLVDNWTDHGATENKGEINLVAGQTYSLVMEYYENGGSAVAELHWSSPRTPKQLIPQAALSLPVKAGSPKPPNGAVDVKQTTILSWSPGVYAASHQVYFGTDEEAVRNANSGSPEFKGSRTLGSESYDPGKLQLNTTYYWRIDEVNNANPDSPWTGNVWSFTTANFLVVDNFEDYDIGENQIWYAWKDGLGYGSPDTPPYYPGNGTGSAVGDETTASYCEETIVHGGAQSMPFFYDNNKPDKFKYSEAELTLTYPRDWTENGVNKLTIWFRGIPDNAAEPMYVALNGSAVVSHDNPNAAQIDKWAEWNIDLRAFADQGVSLTNVDRIAIGFGNRNNPRAGGSGKMYFDDIRLYPPPEPEAPETP